MNADSVKAVIKEIQKTRSQSSASQKDEVRVAKSMMNDREFKVDVYGKTGVESQYCPAEALRTALADQVHRIAKIPTEEAKVLASEYEYTRNDAVVQVDFSKEFINTYMDTGRKLPLGVRKSSDVSLIQRDIKKGERSYPCKVGVNEDGTDRYGKATTTVPAHKSIRVISTCPAHIKK